MGKKGMTKTGKSTTTVMPTVPKNPKAQPTK